jgi:hypothetical protein
LTTPIVVSHYGDISTVVRLYLFSAPPLFTDTVFLPFFGGGKICPLFVGHVTCVDVQGMAVLNGMKEWLFPSFAFLFLAIVYRDNEARLRKLASLAKLSTLGACSSLAYSSISRLWSNLILTGYHLLILVGFKIHTTPVQSSPFAALWLEPNRAGPSVA